MDSVGVIAPRSDKAAVINVTAKIVKSKVFVFLFFFSFALGEVGAADG